MARVGAVQNLDSIRRTGPGPAGGKPLRETVCAKRRLKVRGENVDRRSRVPPNVPTVTQHEPTHTHFAVQKRLGGGKPLRCGTEILVAHQFAESRRRRWVRRAALRGLTVSYAARWGDTVGGHRARLVGSAGGFERAGGACGTNSLELATGAPARWFELVDKRRIRSRLYAWKAPRGSAVVRPPAGRSLSLTAYAPRVRVGLAHLWHSLRSCGTKSCGTGEGEGEQWRAQIGFVAQMSCGTALVAHAKVRVKVRVTFGVAHWATRC